MERLGRVVQSHTNRAVASLPEGRLVQFSFTRRSGRPLPGDEVRLDQDAVLQAVVPRQGVFGRGDARGTFRPIAANVNQVLIVLSPQPAPSALVMHRYLVAARLAGATPLIVVTKSDLTIPETPPFNELAELEQSGVTSILCRCRPSPSIESLRHRLQTGINLLVGQSGVGKSSLLNALIPDVAARTRALSRVTGKGTHTTSTTTLHAYAADCWLADSPGAWEYRLWAMPTKELAAGFPEFAPYLGQCRFRDCRHLSEPGCAIAQAVERGRINARRMAVWQALCREQQQLQ